MKCTACGHENLSDFPFCEQCLELLPTAGSGRAGGFGLLEQGTGALAAHTSVWPPFPWNTKELQKPRIGREKAVDDLLSLQGRPQADPRSDPLLVSAVWARAGSLTR